ncbi:ferredoxin--NADP reductase [Aquimarina sp. ERC-38]|uniref:ferredoxin--NADP reductase n=1 Tax=Aquimarina sp. ERC-38 TaxID=2949996 RepID=UPI002245D31E|nr:ferredoxin--NADP reductase [Aquimarina sp. ERC-38]UZO81894.1 ferredoxin--NADP reductase [Aquimarina sp. ERC-38]
MPDFHPLKIQKITRETEKAVVIDFEIPRTLKDDFTFIPGQYVTLKTEIKGEAVRRAYSICSSPLDSQLSVAVKEVENGTFSTYANRELQEGDTLEVHPPEGSFLLETNPDHQHWYAAFAAGSGITPILSMITSVLTSEPNSSFVLVYGNRNFNETMFANKLLSLVQEYPERLHIEFFYSRRQEENAKFGRIERSTINYIIKNRFKDVDFNAYYLCGPEAMIDTAKEVLNENGVDTDKVHSELFTSSSEPVSLEADLSGRTTISVLVDDETFDFTMPKDQTILNAALEQDIDAPYSCQGGVCSSCICRITEGKAVMEKNSILTDSEIEEGLVLACQAHPVTAGIKVDFDDV